MADAVLTEDQWKPKFHPLFPTAAVMLATFMFVLDSTIANVALPHMAGTFSASYDETLWVLTSYLVASGIVLPSVNYFSKMLGRKNFFLLSILIFTAASFLCGMATSLSFMVIARIIQGFGGGGILPVAQSVLLESFPKEKRGLAMSIFGMGVIVAPIIGPILGGWITDNSSWHWVFYINVPIGFIAILLAKKYLEDPPYAKRQKLSSIDFKGFFLLTIWLVSLQVVLDKGNNNDWFGAAWICWLFAISMIAMVLFIWSQLANKESIIDLSVFKDKNFAIGTALLVVIQFILYGTVAVLPMFLQNVLGYTAFLSGVAIMPRGIGCIIGTIVVGFLSGKVDNKLMVGTGMCCLGIASLLFGFLNLNIAIMNIAIPNFICGFAMGFCFVPMTTLAVETLHNNQLTNATGVQNLLKNIGSAIGTSSVATMISRFSQSHQHMLVGELHPLNPQFAERLAAMQAALSQVMSAPIAQHKAQFMLYQQLLQQSTLWAFMDTFRFFGLICFATMPLLLLFKRSKKPGDSGHTV